MKPVYEMNRSNEESERIYVLYAGNCPVIVERPVYKAYYQSLEHEKYQDKRSLDREWSYEKMQDMGITFEYRMGYAEDSPEEYLLRELRRSQVREAISSLSPLEQRLIQGLYWEEKNQRELAEELGMTQPAVSARKRQILEKLGKLLSE